MYSISFECSTFIHPLGTREGTIAPGRSWRTEQTIRTEYQLGAENWCITTLHDSLGAQIDQKNVTFMTNATCICLGNCNCECDPNALPVKDCISEEASDPGDRGTLLDVDHGTLTIAPFLSPRWVVRRALLSVTVHVALLTRACNPIP